MFHSYYITNSHAVYCNLENIPNSVTVLYITTNPPSILSKIKRCPQQNCMRLHEITLTKAWAVCTGSKGGWIFRTVLQFRNHVYKLIKSAVHTTEQHYTDNHPNEHVQRWLSISRIIVIHYISQSKATKQHCTTSLETSNIHQSSDEGISAIQHSYSSLSLKTVSTRPMIFWT